MQRRIILVGKTGNGKSSTANSILQRDAFTQKISPNSVTKTCLVKRGKSSFNNLEYDVVDTPGLFDTEKKLSERALEIQSSVDSCPEPHAFLIVLSASNRMTKEEQFTIDMLRIMFGECMFNHSIVVFTRGNEFESDKAFQEFYSQNALLRELIKLCKNRVVKIENTTKDFSSRNEETQSILKMIESMSQSGRKFYRYTGLKIHKSVIEEHAKKNNGTGGIQEELSEIVIQIGKKKTKEFWKTMLYGGVLIGGAALAIGVVAALDPAEAAKAVGGAVQDVVTQTADAAVKAGIPSTGGAVVGEAIVRTAESVVSKVKLG